MTEKEYLKQLKGHLSGVKREDRDALCGYYREMIEDRMESGKSEEDAVGELESPATVAARARAEYGMPASSPATDQKRSGLTIALMILGSPLWLALACVALGLSIGAIGLALGLAVAIVAACLGLCIGGPVTFVSGLFLLTENVPVGLINMGIGLVAGAGGVLLSLAVYRLTEKGIRALGKRGKKKEN